MNTINKQKVEITVEEWKDGRIALRTSQWLGEERKGTLYKHTEHLVLDVPQARALAAAIIEELGAGAVETAAQRSRLEVRVTADRIGEYP